MSTISHVRVETPLLCFAFNGEIVRKLAFASFATISLLEEGAQNRLGVGTFRDVSKIRLVGFKIIRY